jgi:hypothetical protein
MEDRGQKTEIVVYVSHPKAAPHLVLFGVFLPLLFCFSTLGQ